MLLNFTFRSHHPRSDEGGFVLVMSLVFLLLLTIIGVTAMNTTSLEEKMAHNVKDKTLSLQGADSAVTMLNNWLDDKEQTPALISSNFFDPVSLPTGLYRTSLSTPPEWVNTAWQTASSGNFLVYPAVPVSATAPFGPSPVTLTTNFDTIFADRPRYILEHARSIDNCAHEKLDAGSDRDPCNVLRFTARAVGGTNTAVSMSQVMYNKRVK
jgi:type IV pilus assembly protein PilX